MLRRTLLIVVPVLAAVALLGVSDSNAEKPFSNNDVQGSYGFSFDGQVLGGPIMGPVAAVGQLNADGDGNMTAVRTLNLAGIFVLKQTAVGTYEVNADGTGTANFTVTTVDPPGFPDSVETFAFVITDNRKDIPFASTTLGIVARGAVKRQ